MCHNRGSERKDKYFVNQYKREQCSTAISIVRLTKQHRMKRHFRFPSCIGSVGFISSFVLGFRLRYFFPLRDLVSY